MHRRCASAAALEGAVALLCVFSHLCPLYLDQQLFSLRILELLIRLSKRHGQQSPPGGARQPLGACEAVGPSADASPSAARNQPLPPWLHLPFGGPHCTSRLQRGHHYERGPPGECRRSTFGPRGVQRGVVEVVAKGALPSVEFQEGYDTDLLNLQPRGSNDGRSPTPSTAARDSTYSLALSRPESYGSENVLFQTSNYGSTAYVSAPYATRAADVPIGGLEDSEKAAKRGNARRAARASPAKSHWWTQKLYWAIIIVSIALIGAGVGLGVGLGLKHSQASTAREATSGQAGSSLSSIAAISTVSTSSGGLSIVSITGLSVQPNTAEPSASAASSSSSGFATTTKRRKTTSSSADSAESTSTTCDSC